eukprot:Phypoly_transcript_05388.p1 GENE.Phypoly_transcript_05388~~Phypoly_transcript_05388.p1  ORF type:complete len:596 (+),score=59.49 Phypoly_transcript_05388:119-1906(+)
MKLFSFLKMGLCDCRQVQDHDSLVDVSPMYTVMFPQQNITPGYFVTCRSHKEHIVQQTILYGEISAKPTFWEFISETKREAILPQQHRIEDAIRLGIPPIFRSKVWQALIGNTVTSSQFNEYKKLVDMKSREDFAAQIALDVTRTFPAIRDPKFIERLSRVLLAYANRNPVLGYCQSMNVLAGALLLFMDEEHAFWTLVYLVEDLLKNYHSLTMSGFLADAEVFKWLVADNLPELHKHFLSLNFDIVALTAPWFLSLYIHELPIVTTFLVWDNIMLEGKYAIFEVALALLRMQQDELLQYDNDVDIMVHIRKRTQQLHKPKKLLSHWKKLDTEKVAMARHTIQQRSEEEASRIALINGQLSEISLGTHFEPKDLKTLWHHYTLVFPLLSSGKIVGLDFKQFSQLIGGTFSEWSVDRDLVERLYHITDLTKDGTVDFADLVNMLSIVCRGTLSEIVQFNFRLFDVKGKGWMDKFDLARMLQSLYVIFRLDKRFNELLRGFVNDIFDFPCISYNGAITIDTFQYVVLAQPKILAKFRARNPKLKYNPKNTYFYWLNMERPHRNTEVVHIALDQQAHMKQVRVPLPTTFGGSVHFAVY